MTGSFQRVNNAMSASYVSRHAVAIDYTNHRGERGRRRIVPLRLIFGKTAWHPTEQWLLHAIDLDKNDERTFALADIHSFQKEDPCTTVSPSDRV